MSARRPSPILIKDVPEPTRGERIKAWFSRLYRRPIPDLRHRLEEVLGEEMLQSPRSDTTLEEENLHLATVQLLPGRLEPLISEVIQQEVRFQRDSSPGAQEVTVGREIGDPPLHVTLDHASVQPLHAKMTYQDGSWTIESLVPGDPVEVNGTPVPPGAGPHLLASGDQVRIGEALFRFHLP